MCPPLARRVPHTQNRRFNNRVGLKLARDALGSIHMHKAAVLLRSALNVLAAAPRPLPCSPLRPMTFTRKSRGSGSSAINAAASSSRATQASSTLIVQSAPTPTPPSSMIHDAVTTAAKASGAGCRQPRLWAQPLASPTVRAACCICTAAGTTARSPTLHLTSTLSTPRALQTVAMRQPQVTRVVPRQQMPQIEPEKWSEPSAMLVHQEEHFSNAMCRAITIVQHLMDRHEGRALGHA